jgi:hypothetical protein
VPLLANKDVTKYQQIRKTLILDCFNEIKNLLKS